MSGPHGTNIFDIYSGKYQAYGCYTLKVQATDLAGNITDENNGTFEFYVDTDAPTVIEDRYTYTPSILKYFTFGIFGNDSVSLSVKVEDNESGCGFSDETDEKVKLKWGEEEYLNRAKMFKYLPEKHTNGSRTASTTLCARPKKQPTSVSCRMECPRIRKSTLLRYTHWLPSSNRRNTREHDGFVNTMARAVHSRVLRRAPDPAGTAASSFSNSSIWNTFEERGDCQSIFSLPPAFIVE